MAKNQSGENDAALAMREPNRHEQVRRSVYGWGVMYIGTRDALIAAGVCNPSPFPGDADDMRTTDSRGGKHGLFITADPHGRQIKISRVAGKASGLYKVDRKEITELERAEAERNKRLRDEEREREREERQEKEQREYRERVRAEARSRYATADEFRRGQAEIAEALPQAVITNMSSGIYGWRLCDEDRDRLLGLKAQLVAAFLNARVVREGEDGKPRLRLVKA